MEFGEGGQIDGEVGYPIPNEEKKCKCVYFYFF